MKDVVRYLASFMGVTAGEAVGAVAAVLGALISGFIAGGAAVLAVRLTLTGQRRDEQKRVHRAILREVIEFNRLAVGHLETCEQIGRSKVSIPYAHLPATMTMPTPIIYPAVADRIGLLQAPQLVVSFFTRIPEIDAHIALIARQTRVNAYVSAADINVLVEHWINLCTLGRSIILEKELNPGVFDAAIQTNAIQSIDAAVASVRGVFPEPKKDS